MSFSMMTCTDGQCGGTDIVGSGALNALTLVKAIDLQILQLEIVVGVWAFGVVADINAVFPDVLIYHVPCRYQMAKFSYPKAGSYEFGLIDVSVDPEDWRNPRQQIRFLLA